MKNKLFLVLAVCLAVSGCDTAGTRSESDNASVENRSSTAGSGQDSGSSARTYGVDSGSTSGMNALEDPAHPLYGLLSERVIYFEYDRSDIQSRYQEIIEAHASYLADNPDVTVTLEGHADERGSREYNLALGERRSISVERRMTLLGARADQIRVVSYGEERPVAQGHDEASWSQNRRVEIIY